jgi:hypothetical protein
VLISGAWSKDQTISRSYSFKLDSASWAAENCNIVVYIDKKAEHLNQSEIQQAIVQAVTWPAGIDQPEPGLISMVALYPNPCLGETSVKINVKAAGNIRLCLVNSMGIEAGVPTNLYASPGIHEIRVSTEGLKPGLYSLLLRGQNEQSVYKLIIR